MKLSSELFDVNSFRVRDIDLLTRTKPPKLVLKQDSTLASNQNTSL